MESFDLEHLSDDPEQVVRMRESIREVEARLDAASIDYRFMIQMLGENLPIPTSDAVAIIAAQAIARKMREWDGEDFVIPLMFGVLITRGAIFSDNT